MRNRTAPNDLLTVTGFMTDPKYLGGQYFYSWKYPRKKESGWALDTLRFAKLVHKIGPIQC